LIRSAAALCLLLAIGVAGYMNIEEWTFFESLYMSIVTFTTVGYEEVKPLSDEGRVFTIFIMVFGVGIMLYILTAMVQFVVEGEFIKGFIGRRNLQHRIESMRNHYILAGFGRVGMGVAESFHSDGIEFVVVDTDQESLHEAENQGYIYYHGDATVDATLTAVGIQEARGLVAAVGSDGDNVFITLTAKGLNPDVVVSSRSNAAESERKLLRAGANRVVSPFVIGGRHLAHTTTRPLELDVIDRLMSTAGDGGAQMVEIELTADSALLGQSVEQVRVSSGAQFLGIKKADNELVVGPRDGRVFEDGDTLIVICTERQLRLLNGQ
jgi:voltage-gated potassium channel